MTSSPHFLRLYRLHIFLHIRRAPNQRLYRLVNIFVVVVFFFVEAEGFLMAKKKSNVAIYDQKMFSMFEHLSILHDTSEVIY